MFKVILTGVRDGIPMIKSIIGIFKKKKPDAIATENKTPEVEPDIKEKLIKLVIEGATVYFVIYCAHKFGITYNDVATVFGLIQK